MPPSKPHLSQSSISKPPQGVFHVARMGVIMCTAEKLRTLKTKKAGSALRPLGPSSTSMSLKSSIHRSRSLLSKQRLSIPSLHSYSCIHVIAEAGLNSSWSTKNIILFKNFSCPLFISTIAASIARCSPSLLSPEQSPQPKPWNNINSKIIHSSFSPLGIYPEPTKKPHFWRFFFFDSRTARTLLSVSSM